MTPDGRLLLISNWCSYDVSVVDLASDREIRRIKVGKYPRGIAITPDSRTAYVAMLGGTRIAKIDLRSIPGPLHPGSRRRTQGRDHRPDGPLPVPHPLPW